MPETTLETRNPKLETDLKELASDIVRRAMSGGATAAECVVREGDEFSTLVRLGQVETLKEAGSRSIGCRVSVASAAGLIARWPRFPSHKTKTGPCSATTGAPSPAA